MEIGGVSTTGFSPQVNDQKKDKIVQPQIDIHPHVKQQEPKVMEQTKEEEKISKETLEEVIKGMNQFLMPAHTSLKFTLHEDLKEYFVAIVDDNTKEVIREIPPKKLLDMYAAMKDFIGIIFDRKI